MANVEKLEHESTDNLTSVMMSVGYENSHRRRPQAAAQIKEVVAHTPDAGPTPPGGRMAIDIREVLSVFIVIVVITCVPNLLSCAQFAKFEMPIATISKIAD